MDLTSRSSKKHKKRKKKDDVEKDMEEAMATIDVAERQANQLDMLKEIFLVYFRVLKSEKNTLSLLPPVLEGISRFVHLINGHIVRDVIEVLRKLLGREGVMKNVTVSLQCIITVFQALKGPGKTLAIDDKDFTEYLYRLLFRFLLRTNERDVELALKCCESVFIARTEYVSERVTAVIKRILIIILHSQEANVALAFTGLARSMFLKYPLCGQLLEAESEKVHTGSYDPEIHSLDFCNASSTTAWELSLLKFHFHPAMKDLAKRVCESSLTLVEQPKRILNNYAVDQGIFNPPPPFPQPNPLHARIQKQQKQNQIKNIFVQAKEMSSTSLIANLSKNIEAPSMNDVHQSFHSHFIQRK